MINPDPNTLWTRPSELAPVYPTIPYPTCHLPAFHRCDTSGPWTFHRTVNESDTPTAQQREEQHPRTAAVLHRYPASLSWRPWPRQLRSRRPPPLSSGKLSLPTLLFHSHPLPSSRNRIQSDTFSSLLSQTRSLAAAARTPTLPRLPSPEVTPFITNLTAPMFPL